MRPKFFTAVGFALIQTRLNLFVHKSESQTRESMLMGTAPEGPQEADDEAFLGQAMAQHCASGPLSTVQANEEEELSFLHRLHAFISYHVAI